MVAVRGVPRLPLDALGRVEGLEHDLCHPLPVSLGIERGLCKQHLWRPRASICYGGDI